MSRPDRYRLGLTPAGAGVLSLFFPGLLIAAASGQRPLVAISIGSGLILLANAVAARLALSKLVITVSGPDAATVGRPFPLMLELDGDRQLECEIWVEGALRGWTPALVPVAGRIEVRSETRGVIEHALVRVRTAAPYGLTSCARTSIVAVPDLVPVAPAATRPEAGWDRVMGSGPDLSEVADPVGLRPFVAGDARRDLHWPTVARTGDLMVKDRRWSVGSGEIEVGVEARAGDELDAILSRARGVIEALLASGHRVVLQTAELEPAPLPLGAAPRRWVRPTCRRRGRRAGGDRSGPVPVTMRVEAPVSSANGLVRRLACAVPGDVGPTSGAGRLVIDGGGLRWQLPS